MFKFVLPVLLVFCVLQSSFARSYADKSDIDYQKLSNEVGQSINKLSTDIGKSIQNISKSGQWIINNLQSLASTLLKDGFLKVAVWLQEFICRVELLMMADGFHLYFPISGNLEAEQEYKVVAIAVSKLMMNLNTMERADKIITNSSMTSQKNELDHRAKVVQFNQEAIEHYLERFSSPKKFMRTFLHDWIQILDQQLEADTELNTDYQKLKAEAETYVKSHPSMQKSIIINWDKSEEYVPVSYEKMMKVLNKPTFFQGIANKMFLKQAVKHLSMIFSETHHKRYLLARALIEKASSSESPVNKVYHKALKEVLNLPIESNDEEISNLLFNSIEIFLMSDPTLNAEIQTLMEKIQGDVIYNSDMLHVDFMPI